MGDVDKARQDFLQVFLQFMVDKSQRIRKDPSYAERAKKELLGEGAEKLDVNTLTIEEAERLTLKVRHMQEHFV